MRDAAIRVALGATRSRVIRQMLTETFLLSLAGGALGVWISLFAVKWFVHLAPATIPRLDEVQTDARVLAFALLASIAAGCLFGILPAWIFPRKATLSLTSACTSTNAYWRAFNPFLVSAPLGGSAFLHWEAKGASPALLSPASRVGPRRPSRTIALPARIIFQRWVSA